jgi:hypothetical protein
MTQMIPDPAFAGFTVCLALTKFTSPARPATPARLTIQLPGRHGPLIGLTGLATDRDRSLLSDWRIFGSTAMVAVAVLVTSDHVFADGTDPYPSGAHLHPIAIPARVSSADSTPIGQSVFGVHPA